ncbi:MAG: flagellar hook assembly protein FlgD [Spirochaetaceae bacterium]|nr:flagellar hook assembly protein FlgD [Spirochaetaceae bacterium]
MDVSTALRGPDLAKTRVEVDAFNKALSQGKTSSKELDKDDFLKILITQLQHQDPTAPLQDKEFIAQMAQFSSLEQMTNMSQGFNKLSGLLASSEAGQVLGRNVEIRDGESLVSGVVTQVVRGDNPLVGVNGKLYDFEQVEKVLN